MVHLIVHLVKEIRLCGPVYLRWMCPVGRYMKVLKRYMKNQYWPEALIVERYVAEESIEFCSEYVELVKPIGLPQCRHDNIRRGKGRRGYNVVTMTWCEINQSHLYVLNKTQDVAPYIDTHKDFLMVAHTKMNMMKVLQEHNRSFINWFKETTFCDDSTSKTLRLLAIGPNLNVPTWKGYDINNYFFYVKSQDDKSSMQNNGVNLEPDSDHFCRASDNNPIWVFMPYFGVIE